MASGEIESFAVSPWLAHIVAADGKVPHQHGLRKRTGHFEVGAEVLFLITAITGDGCFDPCGIMPVVTTRYAGNGLRYDRLGRFHGRKQFRIRAISSAHHLALGANEIGAITAIPEYLIRTQLIRPLRLYPAVHPV